MAVRRSVILAVVIIAALAVSAGYFVNSVSGGGGNNSVTIQVQVPPGGFGNYGNIDTYFPRNFTVTEGDHVTLVFENLDDDPHELTIPAFGVDTNVVPSGQTTR